MSKVIKFCYWVSIPTFLTFLLYNYALLPERVSVYFNDVGMSEQAVTKGMFFYVCLIVFVVSNGLLYAYQKMTAQSLSADGENHFIMSANEWLTGLSLTINITFTSLILFVGIYYSRDIDPNQYLFLIFLGPVLILFWIFYLIYLKFFTT